MAVGVPPDRIDVLERRLDILMRALRQPMHQRVSDVWFDAVWEKAATEPVTSKPEHKPKSKGKI